MIDLRIDQPHHPDALCECGDPECLGPAETVQAIVETLVLDSPILRLVKERNEARRLCELLAAAMPDLAHVTTSPKAMAAASDELHTALITYVKTKKNWDKRSYQLGGEL